MYPLADSLQNDTGEPSGTIALKNCNSEVNLARCSLRNLYVQFAKRLMACKKKNGSSEVDRDDLARQDSRGVECTFKLLRPRRHVATP